jgi:hypothetical protein
LATSLDDVPRPLRAYQRGYAGYPPGQQEVEDGLRHAVARAGTGISTQMVHLGNAVSKESIGNVEDVVSLQK